MSVFYVFIILWALQWPATASVKNKLLGCHNNLARRKVGVRGLSWSSSLARSAQKEANRCVGCHKGGKCNVPSTRSSGENLAWRWTSRDNSATEDVWFKRCMAWVNERNYWTYSKMPGGCRSGKQCGHYTQIVWQNTKNVGCGWRDDCRARTASGNTYNQILVCHYSPGGNVRGQYPYGQRMEGEVADCLEGDEEDQLCVTWNDEKVTFTLDKTQCHNRRPLYYHEHQVLDTTSYLSWVDPNDLANVTNSNTTYEGDGYWRLSNDPEGISDHASCEENDLADCGAGSWIVDQFTDSDVVKDVEEGLYIGGGSCGSELESNTLKTGETVGIAIVVVLVAIFVIVAVVALVWCRWKKRNEMKEMIKDFEEEENENEDEVEVETQTGLVN